MDGVQRLVTSVDVDRAAEAEVGCERGIPISALLELELASGRRVVLLDDRGWSSSTSGSIDVWASTSLESITATARMVVGPDEPPEGRSRAQEAAMYWGSLADTAREQDVRVGPEDLAALPHDVDVSEEVRARLARTAE